MSAADTAAYAMVSDERCGDGSPGCRNNPEHLGRMAIIPGGVASSGALPSNPRISICSSPTRGARE